MIETTSDLCPYKYWNFLIQNYSPMGVEERIFNITKQNHQLMQFLNQDLTIDMFIPAKFEDDEWILLEEPKGYLETANPSEDEWKEWEEAKKKVLFKGFEKRPIGININSYQIDSNLCQILVYKAVPNYFKWNYKQVKDLIPLGIPLTQTALSILK